MHIFCCGKAAKGASKIFVIEKAWGQLQYLVGHWFSQTRITLNPSYLFFFDLHKIFFNIFYFDIAYDQRVSGLILVDKSRKSVFLTALTRVLVFLISVDI